MRKEQREQSGMEHLWEVGATLSPSSKPKPPSELFQGAKVKRTSQCVHLYLNHVFYNETLCLLLMSHFFNLVGCTAWESSSDAIGVVDSQCSSIRGTIHLFGRETCTSLNIGNDFLYAFIPSSNIQKAKWRWNPLCVINCLGLSLHALFMWPCWPSKTLLALTILWLPKSLFPSIPHVVPGHMQKLWPRESFAWKMLRCTNTSSNTTVV